MKKADFEGLNINLGEMILEIGNTCDIGQLWSSWKDAFLAAAKDHIPIRTVKDSNSPAWVDNEVRNFIRKKYLALKRYRQNKTETRKLKLRELSKIVKSLVKRKHKEYLSKIEKSFSTNPKVFWSYHKAILHHRSKQSTNITYVTPKSRVTAKSPAKKAELLNQYFTSVFTKHSVDINNGDTDEYEEITNMTNIGELQVSLQEVEFYLRNLDATKACGPDGLPARILKECSHSIAPSLCELFNFSLRVG
jgi:hypothetical protein